MILIDNTAALRLAIQYPYPALLIDIGKRRYLVIADLHIGFEYELAKYGVKLPVQYNKLLSNIGNLLDQTKPTHFVILGDVKHSVSGIAPIEISGLVDILQFLSERVDRVIIVPGNHDGSLDQLVYSLRLENVTIASRRGSVIRGTSIGIFHGHIRPASHVFRRDTLVMAHIHPVIVIRSTFGYVMRVPVWVKARLSKSRRKLLILPAFNELVGGVSIDRVLSSGSSLRIPIAIDIKSVELYTTEGDFLGSLQWLRDKGLVGSAYLSQA